MRKYKIVLLGYYGFGNLGDELLLEASLNILKKSGFNSEKIIVLSNNPSETSKKFHVESVLRWNFCEVFNALCSSEYLMLGGGGLFQDSTSVKSCVWYWGIIRLAKFLGVIPFAIGQSLGPLNSKISKILTRDAVKLCKIFHVRDSYSFGIAENFGLKNIILGVDLVYTLGNADFTKKSQKNILLNLRPCLEIEKFVNIISGNLKENVIGVALSREDVEVLEKYKSRLNITEIFLVNNFEEAKNLWENALECYGMRLHFGILSRIFRTPIAVMPYDVKVKIFSEQAKIPCITNEFIKSEMPLEISENYRDNICKIMKAL